MNLDIQEIETNNPKGLIFIESIGASKGHIWLTVQKGFDEIFLLVNIEELKKALEKIAL